MARCESPALRNWGVTAIFSHESLEYLYCGSLSPCPGGRRRCKLRNVNGFFCEPSADCCVSGTSPLSLHSFVYSEGCAQQCLGNHSRGLLKTVLLVLVKQKFLLLMRNCCPLIDYDSLGRRNPGDVSRRQDLRRTQYWISRQHIVNPMQ